MGWANGMKEHFAHRDIDDIIKIYIPSSKIKDNKVWTFTKSGQLSTKSAYKILSFYNGLNAVN